jgi:plastocyanin
MFILEERIMRYRLPLMLLAAFCLTACGSNSMSSPTAPAGSTTVTIVSGASALSTTAFAPSPLTVSVGTTVSWLNNDSTTHTSVANNGAWTSPNIAPGGRFNFTLMTAGTFQYHCSIHPNMVGTITVQ